MQLRFFYSDNSKDVINPTNAFFEGKKKEQLAKDIMSLIPKRRKCYKAEIFKDNKTHIIFENEKLKPVPNKKIVQIKNRKKLKAIKRAVTNKTFTVKSNSSGSTLLRSH